MKEKTELGGASTDLAFQPSSVHSGVDGEDNYGDIEILPTPRNVNSTPKSPAQYVDYGSDRTEQHDSNIIFFLAHFLEHVGWVRYLRGSVL